MGGVPGTVVHNALREGACPRRRMTWRRRRAPMLARLKAIIAGRRETLEHTHDLRRLIRVAAHDLAGAPFDVDAVIALTQYSAPLRYEDLLDAEPLDRDATVALVDKVGRWAETQIAEAAKDSQSGEEDEDEPA
jgi:hypothetical protein